MVYNFNPGPAVLPAEVMRQAQAEFVNYHGLGYGIMEASHRAKEFEEVIGAAEANIRSLLGLSADFAVLFLQGGATLQFGMIPMNLLAAGRRADYADTGYWSAKAIKEAKLFGQVRVLASSKDSNYDHIPDPAGWPYDPQAVYLHLTTNNTIYGSQYQKLPTPPAGVPLIADMSSDAFSRPFDPTPFGLIYAGAQKNLGPSGVTLVIIRKDLAEKGPTNLTTMLQYRTYVESNSMHNTPPTFGIYMVRLVTDWIKAQGGLAGIEAATTAKANALYAEIDRDAFYRCPVRRDSRSRMNVVFRLPSEALEEAFAGAAKKAGLIGLKGHRAVGGMRASLYNAMPAAGVTALVQFMQDFRQKHG